MYASAYRLQALHPELSKHFFILYYFILKLFEATNTPEEKKFFLLEIVNILTILNTILRESLPLSYLGFHFEGNVIRRFMLPPPSFSSRRPRSYSFHSSSSSNSNYIPLLSEPPHPVSYKPSTNSTLSAQPSSNSNNTSSDKGKEIEEILEEEPSRSDSPSIPNLHFLFFS